MHTSIRGNIRGDDRYSLVFSIWMIASKPKLNPDKTEFIKIGTKSQLDKFKKCFPTKLLDQDVEPTNSARNLGVEFDKDFNFKRHISKFDHATIIYKICTLTYKVIHKFPPIYLHDLLKPLNRTRNIRFSDHDQLVVPRVSFKMDERAFSVAPPPPPPALELYPS